MTGPPLPRSIAAGKLFCRSKIGSAACLALNLGHCQPPSAVECAGIGWDHLPAIGHTGNVRLDCATIPLALNVHLLKSTTRQDLLYHSTLPARFIHEELTLLHQADPNAPPTVSRAMKRRAYRLVLPMRPGDLPSLHSGYKSPPFLWRP